MRKFDTEASRPTRPKSSVSFLLPRINSAASKASNLNADSEFVTRRSSSASQLLNDQNRGISPAFRLQATTMFPNQPSPSPMTPPPKTVRRYDSDSILLIPMVMERKTSLPSIRPLGTLPERINSPSKQNSNEVEELLELSKRFRKTKTGLETEGSGGGGGGEDKTMRQRIRPKTVASTRSFKPSLEPLATRTSMTLSENRPKTAPTTTTTATPPPPKDLPAITTINNTEFSQHAHASKLFEKYYTTCVPHEHYGHEPCPRCEEAKARERLGAKRIGGGYLLFGRLQELEFSEDWNKETAWENGYNSNGAPRDDVDWLKHCAVKLGGKVEGNMIILTDGNRIQFDGSTIATDGTIFAADGGITGRIPSGGWLDDGDDGNNINNNNNNDNNNDNFVTNDDDDDDDGNNNSNNNEDDGNHKNSNGDGSTESKRPKRNKNRGDQSAKDDTNENVSSQQEDVEEHGTVYHNNGTMKTARRDRIRGLIKHTTEENEDELDFMDFQYRGRSVAVDYLGRYCILNEDQINHYQIVFDNIDRNKDGRITLVELDFGLKTVNRDLLSNHECQYVTEVLEINDKIKLDFRLFSVLAALSQRVVGLEPLVKNIINQLDFNAYRSKISKAKDLFYLLDDQQEGVIKLEDLIIELRSGGLTQEHEDIIIAKFSEKGYDFIDFMDFLTYLPLFVEIHGTICYNPLDTQRVN